MCGSTTVGSKFDQNYTPHEKAKIGLLTNSFIILQGEYI